VSLDEQDDDAAPIKNMNTPHFSTDASPALPPNHPQREALANEVHARPSEAVGSPAQVAYVAVIIDADSRDAERRHLDTLARRFQIAPPGADATHWRCSLHEPGLLLKWERHGEFSSYTVISQGLAQADRDALAELAAAAPAWLAGVPGRTVAAVKAQVLGAQAEAPTAAVSTQVLGGLAQVHTDFKQGDDGCTHMRIVDRGLTPTQSGRLLQSLFEVEAYRVLALLALPIARRQWPRIADIEQSLAQLTDRIAAADASADDDEALLHQLTRLAAEVESGIAASQFRFGACDAYYQLVVQRIEDLREQRVAGLPTVEEFMGRRLAPAVATCATVMQRLRSLAERIAQASSLLSTRVDITRERQNQALLASMDLRAKQQLRLQQTVEGLSVAAIAYYLVGLVGYAVKGLNAGGVRLNPDVTVALAVPVVAGLVWWAVRRARRRIVIAAEQRSSRKT
jgi:uncharacterized membrane-anchored protein